MRPRSTCRKAFHGVWFTALTFQSDALRPAKAVRLVLLAYLIAFASLSGSEYGGQPCHGQSPYIASLHYIPLSPHAASTHMQSFPRRRFGHATSLACTWLRGAMRSSLPNQAIHATTQPAREGTDGHDEKQDGTTRLRVALGTARYVWL